jgi:hypothetical protein
VALRGQREVPSIDFDADTTDVGVSLAFCAAAEIPDYIAEVSERAMRLADRADYRNRTIVDVNRTRNGTCVNRVVLVLWKERAMYGGASCALSLERASANMKMGKNLVQNTRGHRYITVPDS